MMPSSTGRLRILFLTPYMKRGGSQSFISALLDGLDRGTFAPELGTVFEWESEYAIPDDVPVHQVDADSELAGGVGIEWPAEVRQNFANEAAWLEWKIGQVGDLVRRVNPDVVFCSPEWASVMASAAASAFPPATRLICRVDAPPTMAFPDSGTNRLLGILARQYLNRADRIAAVSHAVARDLIENFGVDERRIVLVHNAVDLTRARTLAAEPVDEVPFDDGIPSVVFVGRIERVKGLRYLLTAVAEVIRSRPARCVLVGGGTQTGYLRALATHLGISEHVHFVGPQSNPFKFMSRATAFVLPSLSEGMPTVLVEAMACGAPVIATDIEGGAVRELLEDGACGRIVERADSHALASAIGEVLESETLREEFVRRGLARAQHFDVPRIIGENEALIRSVVHQGAEEGSPDDRARESSPPSTQGHRSGDGRARRPAYLLLSNARHVFRRQGLRAVLRKLAERIRADLPVVLPHVGAASRDVRRAGQVRDLRTVGPRHVTVVVPSMDEPSVGACAATLATRLDRDSWHVSIVEIDPRGEKPALPVDVERFVVRPRHGGRHRAAATASESLVRYRRSLRRFDADAAGLADLACALDTDVVLALGYRASALALWARESLPAKTAAVAGLHGYTSDFANSGEGTDLWLPLLGAGLGAADAVVAPDDDIRSLLAEKLDVPSEAVTVLHDPVEAPASQDPVWSMTTAGGAGGSRPIACRTGPHTVGLDTAFEALALAREQEDVRMVIAGVAPPGVFELATRLGVAEAVDFVDSDTPAISLLADSAAYLDLAADGATGVAGAVVEAIAAGRPVITLAPTDAVADLLGEGQRGVLVAGADAPALAEAMLQLVWDREFAQTVALRARENLKEVAAGPFAARVESILADAICARSATQ